MRSEVVGQRPMEGANENALTIGVFLPSMVHWTGIYVLSLFPSHFNNVKDVGRESQGS